MCAVLIQVGLKAFSLIKPVAALRLSASVRVPTNRFKVRFVSTRTMAARSDHWSKIFFSASVRVLTNRFKSVVLEDTNHGCERTAAQSYSECKLSAGFASAAFIAWKLTVINAINKDPNPATTKIHQPMLIR